MSASPALVLVVAVDGSVESLRAARHALRLCEEAGSCDLYLWNVQPALPRGASRLAPRERRIENGGGSLGHALLREACAEARRAGRRAMAEVLHGDPATEIAGEAAKVRADLILVGTRSLGGPREALLGSVARRLIALARCPVVTAR